MSKYLDKVPLAKYTRKEEWISSISHMVGGGFGILALIMCIVKGILLRSVWYAVTGFVFTGTMIAMYSCSAVYHALYEHNGKKAMRLVDHTMVFLLISGTITPYALVTLRADNPVTGWVFFGVAWGCTLAAAAMIFISFEKTKIPQMILCIAEGWMVIIVVKQIYELLSPGGFYTLLAGGICYTVGAVLYGIGSKKKYFHNVFHFFVLAGSILHFVSVFVYVFK
ncbi:MAG: hemolysin III family protein [Oscillospiraceae bacterium]|nr:hemolysin III family protein [Oscillospiraceae bacterium]